MLGVTKSLPEDPAELRAFTALLLAEVKLQAVLIQKLQHRLPPLSECLHSPAGNGPSQIGRAHV